MGFRFDLSAVFPGHEALPLQTHGGMVHRARKLVDLHAVGQRCGRSRYYALPVKQV